MNNTPSEGSKRNPRSRAAFEPRSSAAKTSPEMSADDFWNDDYSPAVQTVSSAKSSAVPSASPAADSAVPSASSAKKPAGTATSSPDTPPVSDFSAPRRTRTDSAPSDSASSDKRRDLSGLSDFSSAPASGSSSGSTFSMPTSPLPTMSRPLSGVVGPMFVLIVAVVLVALVLPRLEFFSRQIPIEYSVSYSDSSFIANGDCSPEVVNLQKALYKMGYIELDGITGIYDTATLDTVNSILSVYNIPAETSGCQQSNYEWLLTLSKNPAAVPPAGNDPAVSEPLPDVTEPDAGTDGGDTVEPDDEAGEEDVPDTDEEEKFVLIKSTSRLRSEPTTKGSTTYCYCKKGTRHLYLDEATDENGTVWYKIRYVNEDEDMDQEGWVISSNCELESA